MSVRSELRGRAMERDSGQCQWPPSCAIAQSSSHMPLEMAHIVPVGSGGRDIIQNVVMLCKYHHDMHDGRSMRSLHEYRLLLRGYVAAVHGY